MERKVLRSWGIVAAYFSLTTWAILQLWDYRYCNYYNDCVSYLDMADHFIQGDWAGGITLHWSPLYPVIIAAIFRVMPPSAFQEFAALKLINLSIFFILLASFEYFLYIWLQVYNDHIKKEVHLRILTHRIWFFIGHALFAYSFLCLNNIGTDTPDMLAAAFMFIVFAIFLKILRGQSSFTNFFLFGCITGLAYLAKNASLFCLLACIPFLFQQRLKTDRFWPKFIIAIAALLMTISPYIIYISMRAGELILSPAGKLNYVWFVQERNTSIHAQYNQSLRQSLQHPTRQIFAKPDVFEFAEPLKATYPPWFDPYYWFQGCKIHFCPDWLIITAAFNAVYYCQIIFLACLIVTIVIYLFNRGPIVSAQSLASNTVLFVPAIIGFVQYMCVINLVAVFPAISTRYFSVFIIFFVFAALGSLRIKDNRRGSLAIGAGIATTCLCLLIPLVRQLINDASGAVNTHPSEHYQIANELIRLGLHKGDYVANIGQEETLLYWAKLANLKIVADIPATSEFWSMSQQKRQEVLNALKKYGVKMVVYFSAPVSAQSKALWVFNHKNIFERLAALAVPGYETNNPQFKPVNPPITEGWQQLDNLPCWIHRV